MTTALTEEPFKLLVQSVIDYAIYMLDPNGRVTSWNAGAERIKGFHADEIVGKHFSTFYTDEDREAGLPAKVLEIARTEGRFAGDGWRVRKDGSRFWASVVIDRISAEDGELIGFAKITRDMTEQREAPSNPCSRRSGAFACWSRASPITPSTCSTRKGM